MFDPTGSGYITEEQYKEALNCFGIDKPVETIVRCCVFLDKTRVATSADLLLFVSILGAFFFFQPISRINKTQFVQNFEKEVEALSMT